MNIKPASERKYRSESIPLDNNEAHRIEWKERN